MLPAQLLTIAAKCVIRPGLLKNSKTYGGADMLELQPAVRETGVDTTGNASTPYFVKQSAYAGAGFKAYIVDYDEGKLNYQVLGNEANLCFTTTINGCTFSLGQPAGDGTLIVSHTNMKSDKMDKDDLPARGGDDQSTFQGKVARQFHGSGTMVDPSVYWAGGDRSGGNKINITVFGVNDGGWKFYYQRWTFKGGVNTLLGLVAVGTSNVVF